MVNNIESHRKDISVLSEELVKLLTEKNMMIAVSESLTGGMVSESITSVSGASKVFECGICSYSNRIKHKLLDVSEDTLRQYTEYSVETAKEMAQGVRMISDADIGISTTGIAGPSGGSPDKPVGFVCIGVSTRNMTAANSFVFGSGGADERELIRLLACKNALQAALDVLH